MNTKLIMIFVCICLAVALTGCGGGSQPDQSKAAQESEAQENKDPSLDDVVEYFKAQGLQVGEIKKIGIDVEGEQINLYLIDQKIEEELKKIDPEIITVDKSELCGFRMPEPPLKNGNIRLYGIDEHPNKDKIIKIFKEFNKKE